MVKTYQQFNENRSYRKTRKRLNRLTQVYDFERKKVLDLGCNIGFFSIQLARKAATVTAVDADDKSIEMGSRYAAERGIQNIHFVVANISLELIETFSVMDATLFLSVFHHMITASSVYQANIQGPADRLAYGVEILKSLSRKTKVLFFEMGQPEEDVDWTATLPPMLPTVPQWICSLLIKAGFRDIQIISPPELDGMAGSCRKFLTKHKKRIKGLNKFLWLFLGKIFNYNEQDCRYIFKAKSSCFECF